MRHTHVSDRTEEERMIAYTTSEALFEELSRGGDALRKASITGEEALREAMRGFDHELRHKIFSPASTDAIAVQGGPGMGAAQPRPGNESGELRKSDADAVAELMSQMVEGLVQHWAANRAQLQQRMLQLAVNRNDAATAHRLLQRDAKPNVRSVSGRSLLHDACRQRSEEVVNVLLLHGADPTALDESGRRADEMMTLYAELSDPPAAATAESEQAHEDGFDGFDDQLMTMYSIDELHEDHGVADAATSPGPPPPPGARRAAWGEAVRRATAALEATAEDLPIAAPQLASLRAAFGAESVGREVATALGKEVSSALDAASSGQALSAVHRASLRAASYAVLATTGLEAARAAVATLGRVAPGRPLTAPQVAALQGVFAHDDFGADVAAALHTAASGDVLSELALTSLRAASHAALASAARNESSPEALRSAGASTPGTVATLFLPREEPCLPNLRLLCCLIRPPVSPTTHLLWHYTCDRTAGEPPPTGSASARRAALRGVLARKPSIAPWEAGRSVRRHVAAMTSLAEELAVMEDELATVDAERRQLREQARCVRSRLPALPRACAAECVPDCPHRTPALLALPTIVSQKQLLRCRIHIRVMADGAAAPHG